MMRNPLLILIILLLGVLIGIVLRDGVEPTPTDMKVGNNQSSPLSSGETTYPSDDTRVPDLSLDPGDYDDLIVLLEDASLANQQQDQTIAELHARIQSLEDAVVKNPSASKLERSHDKVTATQDKSTALTGEAALIAAGIDSQTANWIQQKLDENEMEKLYLKNTALREGWMNTKRYRQELRELQGRFHALREDIGDDNFDRLLYAVGRRNRVKVRSTIGGSPALQFGLNSGDTIIRYDGKRVFSAGELKRLTSEGDTKSTTSIEVIRNGSPMTLYVPGGPLGIRLITLRAKP
mgnify:CR=1 FL=1